MKKNYLIIFSMFTFYVLNAQTYVYYETEGTSDPYEYINTDSDVDTLLYFPSDETLSSWYTLPFSFSFYGQTVTGYFASDNGYITFDASATTSYSANDTAPASTGPDAAIYAFWDDIDIANNGSGTNDRVIAYTYGTTPNRVHVIQWVSVTQQGGSSNDYIYAAIRLYETESADVCEGEFDVVLNWTYASGFNAVIGCEDASGSTGTFVDGSPNIDFPSVGASADDDVVYTFFTSKQYDMAIIDFSVSDYIIEDGETLSATAINFGTETVTSFNLVYNVDGSNSKMMEVVGVNIAPGETYTISHDSVANLAGNAYYDLAIWTELPNGLDDDRVCNDSLTTTAFCGTGNFVTKYVLLEEFTTTKCGYCPEGAYYVEDIVSTYDDVIAVGIHAGYYTDSMTIAEHEDYDNAFGGGAPTAMVDRVYYEGEDDVAFSRSLWHDRTEERLEKIAECELDIDYTYDQASRELDVTVGVEFVDYIESGDFRINLYVVEDSVVGEGTGYDQVNYDNTTSGHPYYGLGNPIVGFVHRRVVRDVPSTTWGTSSIISTSPEPGDTFSTTYNNIKIKSQWDGPISLVAYVSYYNSNVEKRPIVNSHSVSIGKTTAIMEANNKIFIEVFPNPASEVLYANLLVEDDNFITINLLDALGRTVKNVVSNLQINGNDLIAIPVKELESGIYFIEVSSAKYNKLAKFIVN